MALINLQIEMFLLIIIGYYLGKKKLFSQQTQQQLSNMVLSVFLPCSVIKSFNMDLSLELIQSTFMILCISFGIQFFYGLLNRFLYNHMEEDRKICCQYGTMVSNAGFMGMPIAQGVFGDIGLLYASIFLIPQRIFMWSSGLALFAKEKGRGVFKKVITHPCIVSIFIGLAFMALRQIGIQIPVVVTDTIHMLAGCSTSVSMIVIGGILSGVDIESLKDKEIFVYCFYRLVMIPVVILVVVRVLNLPLIPANLCVLLSAMPAASTTAIMAQKYNCDHLFASRIVFMSTLLSMVTLPCVLVLTTII